MKKYYIIARNKIYYQDKDNKYQEHDETGLNALNGVWTSPAYEFDDGMNELEITEIIVEKHSSEIEEYLRSSTYECELVEI